MTAAASDPTVAAGRASHDSGLGARGRRAAVSTISVVVVLGLWYLASDVLELAGPLFLPSPVAVAGGALSLLSTPFNGATLLGHAWASLQTVLGGWGLAVLVGVPLGVVIGWSPTVRALVNPVLSLLRPIPPIAWIPLAIVWFGIGQGARFFVVFLAAWVPCVINAEEGVRQVDPLLVRAARNLGASAGTILRRVVVPTAMPLILTGVRLSLGNAWMTLVGAELVAASSGLGFLLLNARRVLRPDLVFVAMGVIGLLGAAFGVALRRLEPRLVPWEVSRDGR